MEEYKSNRSQYMGQVSSYPKQSWKLKGFATVTLNLLDIGNARQFIPPELEIVSTLSNKTFGWSMFIHWGSVVQLYSTTS